MPFPLRRLFRVGSARAALLAALASSPALRAEEQVPPANKQHPATQIVDFLDRLPEMLDLALPNLVPSGVMKFYTHPHFGDLLHRDYLRVPLGMRAKVSPHMEVNSEVEGYFTHGLGSGSAGEGFSRVLAGAKFERELPFHYNAGWSAGANFSTPLSRPPRELSDGYRHTMPYVGLTHPLIRKWDVTGYGSLAGDFLSHTALESNFGGNQLHANSLTLSLGAARDWSRFRASLTASYTADALTSNENDHVFAVRPTILIPVMKGSKSGTRVLLTVNARAVWGPDGFESGIGSSVRVEFDYRHKADGSARPTARSGQPWK
jgi:hypothetical protein